MSFLLIASIIIEEDDFAALNDPLKTTSVIGECGDFIAALLNSNHKEDDFAALNDPLKTTSVIGECGDFIAAFFYHMPFASELASAYDKRMPANAGIL